MIGSKKMLVALERQVFEAIRNNNIEGMIEILGLGFDVNVQDYFGRTPIFLAALYNNLLMVEKLAELGADLEIKSDLGDTVLSKMVSKDNPYKKIPKEEQLAIIKVLINWGAKLTTSIRGALPIHIAIQVRCGLDIVKALLAEDTINKKDIFGYASLHLAVLSNQINIVELLIKHNDVNINIQHSTTGDTPLILAARYNLRDIIVLLVIHRAKQDLQNKYGQELCNFVSQEDIMSFSQTTTTPPLKYIECQNKSITQSGLKDSSHNQHQILENRPDESIRSILSDLSSMYNKQLNHNLPGPNTSKASQSRMLSPIPNVVSPFRSSISRASESILDVGSSNSDVSETSKHSTSAILGSPKSSFSGSFTNKFQGALNIDSPRSIISEISQYENISSSGSSISEASRRRNISPPISTTSESTRSSIDSFSPSGSYAVDSKRKKFNHIFLCNSLH
ncbi:ankyrin repeat domain-containing protein [Candidatus Mesenet endosymbiont of Phosphuga atrata]|uniref:ankyrin repeat domain-containing protein n=1 Tax=Candidatus Mesenet endosymbiont of Phosphuga atrata TaxID=3066221 RepID=UPI0030CC05EB